MRTSDTNIQFHKLETESQIRAHDLDAFAATFGNKIQRLFPIWIGLIDGRLSAYCYLHPQVVVYPSTSPRLSAREFYNLANAWVNHLRQYGDPLIVEDNIGRERLFSKLGLRLIGKDVYILND